MPFLGKAKRRKIAMGIDTTLKNIFFYTEEVNVVLYLLSFFHNWKCYLPTRWGSKFQKTRFFCLCNFSTSLTSHFASRGILGRSLWKCSIHRMGERVSFPRYLFVNMIIFAKLFEFFVKEILNFLLSWFIFFMSFLEEKL